MATVDPFSSLIGKNFAAAVMAVEKNGKYKKSFQSMIKQIIDVDSGDYTDSSLDDGEIHVVYEDEDDSLLFSSEENSSHSSNDNSSSDNISIAQTVCELQPGQSFTISNGKVLEDTTDQKEPYEKKKQTLFSTSEQLNDLKIAALQSPEGILDPGAKLGKKKPVKRCTNFDD